VTEAGEQAVEAFIAAQKPDVQPVVRRLRQLVRQTAPDLKEYVDRYGVLRYGRSTGMRDWICYISGHTAHANLGFARGAELADPDGIVEGTGKNLRHVKLRTVEAVERPAVRRLVEAACRL
jgi:hypothetical protein